MSTHNTSLHEFYQHHRQLGKPLVLATIVRTIGSTYRKAGTQMLFAMEGQSAGLLSGGCAESDLGERAQRVFATGKAELAEYDTRGSDDVIWGIGLGCEGAMRILLTRLDRDNDYQPFKSIVEHAQQHKRTAFALALEGSACAPGTSWQLESANLPDELREAMRASVVTRAADIVHWQQQEIFVSPIELPPRLLILGAGADAMPVVEIASLLDWQVHLVDHRPAYAIADRFPKARAVVLSPAKELTTTITINEFDAAVVMSHHLPTDQIYLEHLAHSTVRYVGLLGPAARRQRLLTELGEQSIHLQGRLAGPVGLDIGAKSPQAIALAIVAEIHAHLAHRSGGSFSNLLKGL
jgi:xanthine dehydrogenase accessory factor